MRPIQHTRHIFRRVVALRPVTAQVIAAVFVVSALVILLTVLVPRGRGGAGTPVDVHASRVLDVSDDRRLVGFAEDVFLGRVIAHEGDQTWKATPFLPEKQYAVEVTELIKGKVAGRIVVNVMIIGDSGSIAPEGQRDTQKSPLRVGESYLFATRQHPNGTWHTVLDSYGRLLVKSPEQRQELAQRFRSAKATEIPHRPSDPTPTTHPIKR